MSKTKEPESTNAVANQFDALVRFAAYLCRAFGHRMFFDTDNAAGSSTCKRCGHKKPAIEWDRA